MLFRFGTSCIFARRYAVPSSPVVPSVPESISERWYVAAFSRNSVALLLAGIVFAVHSGSALPWTLIASPGKTCLPSRGYCIVPNAQYYSNDLPSCLPLSHYIYRSIDCNDQV